MSTERTYYLVSAFYHSSWAVIGPIYALFLLDRGLNLLEINLVLATFLITSFVFEVPTGAVADVFGRKVSFVLSCLVRMVAFLLYAVSNEFWVFLVAEFIDAVGLTLATGALDAWAVDGMRREGHDGKTERFFARAQVLTRALMIVSGLAGGYLATAYGIELPWFIAAAIFLVTAILSGFVMADDRATRTPRAANVDWRIGVRTTIVEGWHEVRRHRVMRLLCFVTFATTFATMTAQHYWPPRLQALSGEGYWLMGWIWALFNLAALIASGIVPYILRWPREQLLAAATLMRGVMLGMAAAATTFQPAFLGILLFELGFGFTEPLMLAWMNDHAEPERRATVLSVRQMSFTLGGGIGLCLLGLVALHDGIPLVWGIGALVLIAVAPVCLALGRAQEDTDSASDLETA